MNDNTPTDRPPDTVPNNAAPPAPDVLERIATTLDALLGEVRGMRADLANVTHQVDDHERRISRLERGP
jgi:hypothetical protein